MQNQDYEVHDSKGSVFKAADFEKKAATVWTEKHEYLQGVQIYAS